MKKLNPIVIPLVILLLLSVSHITYAGDVKILAADFHSLKNNHWSVNVTLKHDDTGWDHYADNWRVVDSEGNVLGDRILFHPHVSEQPFTRSLGDLEIPEGVLIIYIEAHDKVHGWTKNRLRVELHRATGGQLSVEAKAKNSP